MEARPPDGGRWIGALATRPGGAPWMPRPNHLHLVVEVDQPRGLSRGMQRLGVRLARGLNRMMGRTGKVFADRFHCHVLRTPTEARHALDYVRCNAAIHEERQQKRPAGSRTTDRYAAGPGFASWATAQAGRTGAIAPPRTWLLRVGWLVRKAGAPAARPMAVREAQDAA